MRAHTDLGGGGEWSDAILISDKSVVSSEGSSSNNNISTAETNSCVVNAINMFILCLMLSFCTFL